MSKNVELNVDIQYFLGLSFIIVLKKENKILKNFLKIIDVHKSLQTSKKVSIDMNPKAISFEVIRFFLTLICNNSIIDSILLVFGPNRKKFNYTNTTHAFMRRRAEVCFKMN